MPQALSLTASLLLVSACTKTEESLDSAIASDSPTLEDSAALVDSDPLQDSAPPADRDGDGYSEAEGDCDDEDPSVHPGAGPQRRRGRPGLHDRTALEAPTQTGTATMPPRAEETTAMTGIPACILERRTSPATTSTRL